MGIIVNISVYYIIFLVLGLILFVVEWFLYEYIFELVGYIFWFWSIEVICCDLCNCIIY